MFVNFALDILGTSVSCDKVSTDGHEVSNLVCTDYMTRRKGYLAEHFVKAPVYITFVFPCSVNISHVTLNPYIGQQQSLQLELLCAYKPPPRIYHGKKQHKANVANSHQSSNESNLPAFHPVSKITCCTQSSVCFYNPRFPNRPSSHHKKCTEFENKAEMRHSRSELFTCASHIMVKISRTLRSSTPALNSVEIWGCVSSSVSIEVKQVVEQKYLCFVTPETPSISSLNANYSTDHSEGSESKKSENKSSVIDDGNHLEVPEEFLDPITCEVMTIPILLPCGKNVDKSSLDRFSNSEASHGRRPRDPFTGVEFSATIKPIPNVDLKMRIDSFIMSNTNVKSISSLPRTLGKQMPACSQLRKRKMNDNDNDLAKMSVSSLLGGVSDFQSPLQIRGKHKPGIRTTTIHINRNTNHSKTDDGFCSSHSAGQSSSLSASSSSSNASGYCGKDSAKFHDARLKDSLDSALFSILSSTSRHTQPSLDKSGSNSDKGLTLNDDQSQSHSLCEWCGKGDSDRNGWTVGTDVCSSGHDQILYATPCHHVICRSCLLAVSCHDQDIVCRKCGTRFQKKDVVRSHS